MEKADIEALGSELFDAENGGYTVSPLTDRDTDLDQATAYAVQSAYADLRLARGDRLVGYKVGATNPDIQAFFAVDQPDFGHLFDAMEIAAGEPVRLGSLIQPLIEPELAFRLARPLIAPVTADDVLAATDAVFACFEIIDSRIDDWKIKIGDTISDNGSSAQYVLGTALDRFDALDQETVTVLRNGETVATGSGSAVLGHPAASAAWLVNRLATLGVALLPGQILLSGSFTTAIKIADGDRMTAKFSSGASVSIDIAQ